MLARKSRIIFLIGNRKLRVSSISYLLDEFVEDSIELRRHLSERDLREIGEIRRDKGRLARSYLLSRLRHYLTGYWDRLR